MSFCPDLVWFFCFCLTLLQPTFQDEASASQDFVLPEFRCLCFREVYFRYPGTQEARPALAFGGRKHRRRRRKSSFSSQESMDGLVELEETGEEEEEEEMGNGNPSDHNEDGFAGTERLEDHLCFRAGRVYAVVGRNRSGKSTLMQLLCKIHGQQGSRDEEAERREAAAPDGKDSKRRRQKDGEERNRLDVWLNGCSDDSVEMEFSRIPRVAWRNCLSYIPQHPFIFQGTIADNIRMARPDASPEEVLRAAQAAGVFQMEDDPASLPTSTTAASGGGGGGGGGRDRRSSPSDRRNSLTDQPLPEYTEADAELRRLGSLPVRRKPWEENRLANGVFAALDWLSRRLPGVSLNPKQDDGDLPRGDIFSEENGSSAWEGKTAMHTATEAAAAATTTAVSTMMLEAEAEHHRKILGIQTEASGLNLSGGFAQSVALARLYLRPESKIVILDEAMARVRKGFFFSAFCFLFSLLNRMGWIIRVRHHHVPFLDSFVDDDVSLSMQMDGVKKRENILPNLLKFAREKNVCLIVVTHDVSRIALSLSLSFSLTHACDTPIAGDVIISDILTNDYYYYYYFISLASVFFLPFFLVSSWRVCVISWTRSWFWIKGRLCRRSVFVTMPWDQQKKRRRGEEGKAKHEDVLMPIKREERTPIGKARFLEGIFRLKVFPFFAWD